MSYKQAFVDRLNSRNPRRLVELQHSGKLEEFLNALESDAQAEESRLAKQLAANDKEKGPSREQKEQRARNPARELVLRGLNDLL